MKVYHHNDLDGYGAAAVIKYCKLMAINLKHENCQFIELDHVPETDRQKLSRVLPDEEIYIVDYSFSKNTEDVLRDIMRKTNNLVWIDHHRTSLELESTNPKYKAIQGIRREGISGAALTYMWLYKHDTTMNLPVFLKYISDYDCWQKKYVESEYFKLGTDVVGIHLDSELWETLFDFSNERVSDYTREIIQSGSIVMDYLTNNYKDLRERYGYESEIDGVPCYVVNSEGNSWVFGDLINKYPMTVLWSFDGENYIYSLYSAGNVDCSKIAVKHGGGGHPGASGFISKQMEFPKKVYQQEQPVEKISSTAESVLFNF